MNEELSRQEFERYLRKGTPPLEVRAITTEGIKVSREMAILLDHHTQSWAMWRLVTVYGSQTHLAKAAFFLSDVEIAFTDEGGAYTLTHPELKGYNMELHKAGGLTVVAEELIEDSGIDIERLLARSFGRSLGSSLERAFINGNGSKKPRGFLLDCQSITAQAGDLTYKDITKLYKSLDESLLPFTSWIVNRDAMAMLSGLGDDSGNRFLIPDTTMQTAGFVFGRPVYVSLMPPEKPVAFGDFSQYLIAAKPASILRLDELYSEHGKVGFLFKQRLDGRLFNNSAVTALELRR